ncbi:zf-HC2 domain-containing protein [bacterium]|nr:MAG: zf-HC2 domain-containing protein [bacterium]
MPQRDFEQELRAAGILKPAGELKDVSHKLSCKEILEKLSEYIDEELDPSICDEVEKHM